MKKTNRVVEFKPVGSNEPVGFNLDEQDKLAVLRSTSELLKEVKDQGYMPHCDRILGSLATGLAMAATAETDVEMEDRSREVLETIRAQISPSISR